MKYPFLRRLPWLCLLGLLATSSPSYSQSPADSVKAIKKALTSDSPDRQRAALVLIPALKINPEQSGELIQSLIDFLPKATTETLQTAWLRSYGKLFVKSDDQTNQDVWPAAYMKFPKPADSVKRLTPFLAKESTREPAAESLWNLIQAAIQKVGRPSVLLLGPDKDLDTEQRIALGLTIHPVVTVLPWLPLFDGPLEEFTTAMEAYLPLLAQVLNSNNPVTQKWGLNALKDVSTAVAENFPDPNVKREKELSVRPYEAKIKWLLIQPVLKAIDQQTPKLTTAMQSRSTEVKVLANRTAEAVAQSRRLTVLTRDFEISPEGRLVPLADDDFLLPGLKSLTPTLFSNLRGGEDAIRLSAMEALENYESAIWDQRANVIAATQDRYGFTRWVAARALGKMLPKKPQNGEEQNALMALSSLLRDGDIDVRSAALVAIQRFGEYGKNATDAIIDCINRGDYDVRILAITTLEAVKPDPHKAALALANTIGQGELRVRRAAAASLAGMGEKGQDALPALRAVLDDPDLELRRLASEAILAIEK